VESKAVVWMKDFQCHKESVLFSADVVIVLASLALRARARGTNATNVKHEIENA